MSRVIGIMGESGSGKTTSLRNLNPETTFYIDCDKKGLSWKGWRKQYNKDNKNYLRTDDKDAVMEMLAKLNLDNGTLAGIQKRRGKNPEILSDKAKETLSKFDTVVSLLSMFNLSSFLPEVLILVNVYPSSSFWVWEWQRTMTVISSRIAFI